MILGAIKEVYFIHTLKIFCLLERKKRRYENVH